MAHNDDDVKKQTEQKCVLMKREYISQKVICVILEGEKLVWGLEKNILKLTTMKSQ